MGGRTSGTRRGNGPGWGGPKRGEGHKITDAADAKAVQALRTPERKAGKEARAAALLDHLETLAFNAERQETQLAAASAALDRLVGKPVQTQVNIKGEPFAGWTPEQLEAAADAIERNPDLAGRYAIPGGATESGKPH